MSHHGRKRQSGRSATENRASRQVPEASLRVRTGKYPSRRLFRGSVDSQECLNRLWESILGVRMSQDGRFRHFGWCFQLGTVSGGVQIRVSAHSLVNMASSSVETPKSS